MPNRSQQQDLDAQQDQAQAFEPADKGPHLSRGRDASGAPRPSGSSGAVEAVAGNQWAVTGIVVAVVVVLCLIIGFATRGSSSDEADGVADAQAASAEAQAPSADVVASEEAASAATTSAPTITADQVQDAIDDGAVTFDGSRVSFSDPQFSVTGTTLAAQDDYNDPDASVEQAVALAYYVFTTDPSITQVTFQSMSSSGSASVSITIDSSATSPATLRELQGDSPESIYPQLYSYTISQRAHDAMGYDIPVSGGTSAGSGSASGAASTANSANATSTASTSATRSTSSASGSTSTASTASRPGSQAN